MVVAGVGAMMKGQAEAGVEEARALAVGLACSHAPHRRMQAHGLETSHAEKY